MPSLPELGIRQLRQQLPLLRQVLQVEGYMEEKYVNDSCFTVPSINLVHQRSPQNATKFKEWDILSG